MTPSQQAKQLGCKSLAQVAKVTGQSKQTLINWCNGPKHIVFKACCYWTAKTENNKETTK